VMVEPDGADQEFAQGTEVLLVSREGAKFLGIVNPTEVLSRADDRT